jgi:excisionase family DNA binding protein
MEDDVSPKRHRRQPLKLDQAAEELGVSLDAVRDAVKAGDLKSFKIGRRRLIPGPWFDRL